MYGVYTRYGLLGQSFLKKKFEKRSDAELYIISTFNSELIHDINGNPIKEERQNGDIVYPVKRDECVVLIRKILFE